MAEFDDDQMKEIFGKLHSYDSPSTGISWSSVEKRLSTPGLKVGGKAFLALLVPASLIIWLSVDDPTILADAVSSGIRTTNSAPPHSSSAQQPAVQNAAMPDNTSHGGNSPRIVGRKPVTRVQDVPPFELIESQPAGNEVALMPEKVTTQSSPEEPLSVVEEGGPQVAEEIANSVDSSAITVAPEARMARRAGFSLEALYLFGIVDPLKGDNRIVQEYISKPGFGLSGSVNIPVSLRKRSSLYIVPSLHVLYKPYDFDVVEYEDETTSVLHKAGKSLVAYAGVGVMWNVRTWQAEAAFHVGARKDEIIFARTLLSLSLKKDLVRLADDRLRVTVGGSIMLPVSGNGEYLKYTPITIGIGIRKP